MKIMTENTVKVGTKMNDGSIYAGISPDTNQRMYVTAEDAPKLDSDLYMNFFQAAKCAKNLDAHGHKDWYVPTKAELNVLRQNREEGALKGTFNSSASPAGAYWSSTSLNRDEDVEGDYAWSQSFSDGEQDSTFKDYDMSVRCVRYTP